MNPVVIGNLEWLAILTELVAATNPWNGALISLFKNDIVPDAASLLADLTEADFSGYAASAAVTWGTPHFLPDGTAVVAGDAKTFVTASPAPVLNTVFGWYATDGAGTTLLFARRLDTPIVLTGPNQQVAVLPAYPAYTSAV